MRNDHAFAAPLPTPEAIELAMQRARRMRSEVVHGYLGRAVTWLGGIVRARPAPAPQHC
jgi:hypothetical protein